MSRLLPVGLALLAGIACLSCSMTGAPPVAPEDEGDGDDAAPTLGVAQVAPATAPPIGQEVLSPMSVLSATDAVFSFGEPTVYQSLDRNGAMRGYHGVAVGDINGDRRDDVIAQPYDNLVQVFLQGSDGRLQPPIGFRYADDVYFHRKEMVLADFDGDGVLEAAVSDLQGIAMVGLNRRDTISLRHVLDVDSMLSIKDWTLVDENQDGHPDIVGLTMSPYIETECGDRGPGDCSFYQVVLGDGVGGLELGSETPLGRVNFFASPSADVNGDGRLDFVYSVSEAAYLEPGEAMVALQQPGGGFGVPRVLHDAPSWLPEITLADFTGDGRLDSMSSIWLRVGMADGSFQAPVTLPAYGLRHEWPLTADFDGNGRADLVTVQLKPISGTPYSNPVLGLYLQGDAGLGEPWISPAHPELDKVFQGRNGLASGDFNGDRCGDLVVAADYEGVIFFPGQGCVLRVPPVSDESGSKQRISQQ